MLVASLFVVSSTAAAAAMALGIVDDNDSKKVEPLIIEVVRTRKSTGCFSDKNLNEEISI